MTVMSSDIPTKPPIPADLTVFDVAKIFTNIDAWKQIEFEHRPFLDIVNHYSKLDRITMDELLEEFKEID